MVRAIACNLTHWAFPEGEDKLQSFIDSVFPIIKKQKKKSGNKTTTPSLLSFPQGPTAPTSIPRCGRHTHLATTPDRYLPQPHLRPLDFPYRIILPQIQLIQFGCAHPHTLAQWPARGSGVSCDTHPSCSSTTWTTRPGCPPTANGRTQCDNKKRFPVQSNHSYGCTSKDILVTICITKTAIGEKITGKCC